MATPLPAPSTAGDLRGHDLIAAARLGSVEALGALFESARGYLCLAAARDLPRSIRDVLSASDLVQEALANAHRRFDTFRGSSPAEFLGWMRTILGNQAIDHVRRRRTARRDHGRPRLPIEAVGSEDDALQDDVREEPDSVAIRGEDALLVEAALAALPSDQRRVLWSRHWEGKPFDVIASELGRTESAIRKSWSRGLERLEAEILRRAGGLGTGE